MNYFDNWFIVWIDVQNRGGDMIFDASIRDDNGREGIIESLKSAIIKIFDMTLDVLRVWIKRKTIWKSIFESVFQRELMIE